MLKRENHCHYIPASLVSKVQYLGSAHLAFPCRAMEALFANTYLYNFLHSLLTFILQEQQEPGQARNAWNKCQILPQEPREASYSHQDAYTTRGHLCFQKSSVSKRLCTRDLYLGPYMAKWTQNFWSQKQLLGIRKTATKQKTWAQFQACKLPSFCTLK